MSSPFRSVLLTFAACALALTGASVSTAVEPTPVTIPRSESRTVQSTATGREHRIFIAWPDSPPPAAGFPVIYLLDANAWFGVVVETARVLAGRPEGTGVGPAIIVGLGYPTEKPFDQTRRALDYTPAGPDSPSPGGREFGGADAFLRFIEDEVKPAIARDFSVDPSRQVLIGHSYGGLFVLHVLFTAPAAFQNYVAISPSIWWGNRSLLAAEPQFPAKLAAAAAPDNPRGVFFAVGEFEQSPDPARTTSPERIEKLRQNRMVDNARELAARLASLPGAPLRVQFTEFPGENHGSVVPGAITRALPFVSAASAATR